MESLDIKFGKYTLIAKIGDGGMAEVYRARVTSQSGFEKVVALKKIHSSLSTNDRFVKNFINEARLCGQLHHHNVVEVYEFDKVGDTFYLAMEFIDGMNLEEMLRQQRKREQIFPTNVVMSILLQVVEGLNYAHNAKSMDGKPLKVIHRDLKPSNILIDSNGVVKIVDFGVAKADMQRYATQEMTAKGTASYMAPELILGEQPASAGSDLFAVGAILYEMLTLQRLFDGDHVFAILKKVATSNVDDIIHALAPEDRRFEGVLRKLLARNPEQRVQSAEEVLKELKSLNVAAVGPRHLVKYIRELQEDMEEENPTLVNKQSRTPVPAPAPVNLEVESNPLYQTSPTRVAFAPQGESRSAAPLGTVSLSAAGSAAASPAPAPAAAPAAPSAPTPPSRPPSTDAGVQRTVPIRAVASPPPEEGLDDDVVTRVVDMNRDLAPVSSARAHAGENATTIHPPRPEPHRPPPPQVMAPRPEVNSRKPMVIAAIIMLSILAAGFLLIYPKVRTYGVTLDLRSEPEGATVEINGRTVGPAPNSHEERFKAPGATLEIIMSAQGYLSQKTTLNLTPESPSVQAVSMALKPAPVKVKFTSYPPGAAIIIDGKARGELTPSVIEIEQGTYRVRMELDGFLPYDSQVQISTRGEAVNATLEAQPAPPPRAQRRTRANTLRPHDNR